MEIAKLALLTLAYLCGYGALLGGTGALIIPEAFTLGKPPVFGNLPAPLLGILWGIGDFLIPGAMTGVAIGLAANFGPYPALLTGFFRKPLGALVIFIAFVGITGGVIGHFAVINGAYEIHGPMRGAVDPARHSLLAATWWAYLGSLVATGTGALAIAGWTWKKRGWIDRMLSERGE